MATEKTKTRLTMLMIFGPIALMMILTLAVVFFSAGQKSDILPSPEVEKAQH